MTLADDALFQGIGELEDGLDLVFHHAPNGDSCPALDHSGNCLLIHGRQDQGTLSLQRVEFGL